MTTTDTSTTDSAKLEAAEETLGRIVCGLEHHAANAPIRNKRHAVQDRTSATAINHPDATALTLAQCEELIDALNEALDCLQIGLGRPYVWLLKR
jgi:hypothetical protein